MSPRWRRYRNVGKFSFLSRCSYGRPRHEPRCCNARL